MTETQSRPQPIPCSRCGKADVYVCWEGVNEDGDKVMGGGWQQDMSAYSDSQFEHGLRESQFYVACACATEYLDSPKSAIENWNKNNQK